MGWFGGSKSLSSKDKKKIFDDALSITKKANGSAPSLRSLLSSVSKQAADSATVTELLKDFGSYGMQGAADSDPSSWWDAAKPDDRVKALETTSQCLA